MAESKDDERDEEWFKEVYGKEYTGPVRPANDSARDNPSAKKRSLTEAIASEPDEDDGPPDPNAVPTDFTSREAKVWEAKAKAIERNWKKKKEEELICRICGEYGHFSQGCPSTLGVNRRQSEVVEKIPVKDRRLKPRIIGTAGATVQGIEKDTGCRLKLEDNLAAGNGSFFVRISGSNRAMVGKAVDAVKRLLDHVQDDRKPQSARKSHGSHNRTPDPLAASHMQHIASQQTQYDPNVQPYAGQEGPYYDEQHSSMDQMARRQWETGNQNGSFGMASFGLKGGPQYDERSIPKGVAKEEDRGRDVEAGFDQQAMAQTLEALEQKFVQETMQLTKDLNDAEDSENARHRQSMREIQEQYQQKMVSLRAQQGKRRDEFLRQEAHFRQQHYQQYQHQQPQAGSKFYNYDMGGPMPGGFNNGPREQPGYGAGSVDRNDGPGDSYGSFRGGSFHSSSHSYRNAAYDSGMMHSGNQGYEAVEDPNLLDSMDNIPPKSKEDVRKILSSKQLFYKEICAYHSGCKSLLPSVDFELQRSVQAGSMSQSQDFMDMGRHHNGMDGGHDDDEDDDDDADKDEDGDYEDHDVTNTQADAVCGFTGPFGRPKRSSRKLDGISSPLLRYTMAHALDPPSNMDQMLAMQDGGKLTSEQQQSMRTHMVQLEEQKVGLLAQALELEKQRFKWERVNNKKNRELEQLRLDNKKMKLENERMSLTLKQKELEVEYKRSEASMSSIDLILERLHAKEPINFGTGQSMG